MSLKFLAAAVAFGLTASAAELPQLRIEPVAGASVFYIKNVASQPLTAYLVELDGYPGSSFGLLVDLTASEPIPPGTEKSIHVSDMTVGAAPEYVKVESALYADGSSAGSPEKVKQLVDHRRFLLEKTRELIGRLEKAKSAGTDKATVAADLKQLADALRPNVSHTARYAPAGLRDAAARTLILDTIAKINAGTVESALAGLHADEHALAVSKPSL